MSQTEIAKITKTPYFGGSRSYKVIDVDIFKKYVANACYNKQHVCAYLQPFLRARASIAIARIRYGNSVRPSVRLGVCHVLIPLQEQMKWKLWF